MKGDVFQKEYDKMISSLLRNHLGKAEAGDEATTEIVINTEPISFESIQKAIKKLPICPFKQFMEEQNYPPSQGWILLIPIDVLKPGDDTPLPSYVIVSPHIDEPCFVNSRILTNINRSPII